MGAVTIVYRSNGLQDLATNQEWVPGAVIETATWGYESPVCLQQPGHHSYLESIPLCKV